MAPEYGATTGFFPVDDAVLSHLRLVARDRVDAGLVEAHHRAAGLWFDPEVDPDYTRTLELDLGTVRRTVAGPHPATGPAAAARHTRLPWVSRPAGPGDARASPRRRSRSRRSRAAPTPPTRRSSSPQGCWPATPGGTGSRASRGSRPRSRRDRLRHSAICTGPGCSTTCRPSGSTSSGSAARRASATPVRCHPTSRRLGAPAGWSPWRC